jgi:mannose-6-phosphate isomerase-like protein (cupin superfamily)
MDGIVIPPDAQRVARGTGTFRILAELDELEVIDMRFGPEFEGVDPHTHADLVDAFYALEGQVEFRVGDEPRVAGPRTFVAAPRGSVHGFRHAGPEPIRFLNLHAPPGGFIDRLRAS